MNASDERGNLSVRDAILATDDLRTPRRGGKFRKGRAHTWVLAIALLLPVLPVAVFGAYLATSRSTPDLAYIAPISRVAVPQPLAAVPTLASSTLLAKPTPARLAASGALPDTFLTSLTGILEGLNALLPTLKSASGADVQSQINALQNQISQTNRISNLSNVTVTNITGIKASDIPALSYLPLGGGTIDGTLTTTGTSTFPSIKLLATDCSAYGNGGKLTTDSFGYLVCADDYGATGGAGAPGGATTQVQFNDAGSFAGSTNFTFNKAAGRLTILNASTTNLSANALSATTWNGFTPSDLIALGFSTTSANSYLSQKTTSDLAEGTNKYYQDSRVGAYISSSSTIPHVAGASYGDLLYWSGSAWSRIATSSLGIVGGGGGASSWGSITGTLSAQTDLNAALSARLSLTDWYATTTDALHEGTNKFYKDSLVSTYLNALDKGIFFSTTSADVWGSQKGYVTSLTGAASSTLLSDTNTWTALNTFGNVRATNATTTGTSYLGTVLGGIWQGSQIADAYIASASSWNGKQEALVSGTTIKTVNGSTLLGSGDLVISTGSPFPFTPVGYGVATSTTIGFTNGLLSMASSTFTGNTFFAASLGIGTTTTSSRLTVQGSSGSSPIFSVASSTGQSLFAVNGDGSISGNFNIEQLTHQYQVDAGSSAISVGDVVGYVNGKAQKAVTGGLPGTPVALNNVNSIFTSAAALDSTHFVVAYRNASVSPYAAYVVIGTVSGNSISYGTPVALNNVNSTEVSVAVLDSTHFVVAYENGDNSFLYAVVASVSGTSITAGTPVQLHGATSTYVSVAALDSTHFVVGYRNQSSSGYVYAVAATVSGTGISAGSPTNMNANDSEYISVAALSPSKFVLVYRNNTNFGYASALLGTVSGNAISSSGGVTALNGVSSYYLSVAALDSTHFAAAYQNNSGNTASAVASSISGTTIYPGTPVALNTVGSGPTSVVVLDPTHFVAVYQNASTGYADAVLSTVSGTAVAPGAVKSLNSQTSNYVSAAALDGGHFVAAYRGPSGYAYAIAATISQQTGILGIATSAASAGGTVSVASNGVVTGISGLTPGAQYYWKENGGYSTSTSGYRVGVALSSTSMLLNSGAGAGGDQYFGDMIFANNFRITEGWDYPNALIFKNQLGREVMRMDENGNLNVSGAFTSALPIAGLAVANATTTVAALTAETSDSDDTNAENPSNPPRPGPLAGASVSFKSALTASAASVAEVFDDVIYATTAIFDHLFAREIIFERASGDEIDTIAVKSQTLCLDDVCITKSELKTLLDTAGIPSHGQTLNNTDVPPAEPPAPDPDADSAPPDSGEGAQPSEPDPNPPAEGGQDGQNSPPPALN